VGGCERKVCEAGDGRDIRIFCLLIDLNALFFSRLLRQPLTEQLFRKISVLLNQLKILLDKRIALYYKCTINILYMEGR
jgi:hypothetical protein